jgi:hypothetical protein
MGTKFELVKFNEFVKGRKLHVKRSNKMTAIGIQVMLLVRLAEKEEIP